MATQDPGVSIEIDETEELHDSDYDSGSSEYSTESLASSVFAYRYENGRRYHARDYGNYTMPNDEKEQDRLDIMHHVYLLLLEDKLHLAPIGLNPQRILDIGTGTGIWAMDMAERYPSAQVIGTDLSPIQPSWVPPNVEFQIDDAEKNWTWAVDTFDYIHIRHLVGPISDWPRLLKQAYRCTKPGGYVEIQEYDMNLFSDDGSYENAHYLKKFYAIIHEAAKKIGQDYRAVPTLAAAIEGAGFENLKYQTMKVPLGSWPADPKQKQMGNFLLMNAATAYEAVGLSLMTTVMGMPPEEVNPIMAGCLRDSKSRKIHSYSRQHMFYAQKPYY